MPEQIDYRIAQYHFSKSDNLLFDANVWLYLHHPQYKPSNQQTRIYSSALKRMLEARNRIFIDALVLSEFVNVLARYAFHVLSQHQKDQMNNFKSFRKSSKFRPVAKDIVAACRKILGFCTRIESQFVPLNIDALLSQYEGGASDLNDLLLANLCKSRNLTLVTDDGDFRRSGLKVLTANNRLLH
jgi:predicted nucleic acid-binding protein